MTAADKIAGAPFQSRVQPWMTACFGPEISGDRLERSDRLLEEVLELLQSGDYPRERIAALTGYVWSRPKGEPVQEVGGVMVTLAAYCLAHGLDMHEAGETELARIWNKVEKIRAKQAAKPTGSALPQAWPEADLADALAQEIARIKDENADLKTSVVAFGAVHAVAYAKQWGLPDGHLHPHHYDILEKAGARMVDFTRADLGDAP